MALEDRLTKAQSRLNAYYEAELAVLEGQEYEIGDRSLTRADLAEIRKAINQLENQVNKLEAAIAGEGIRATKRIVPRDL